MELEEQQGRKQKMLEAIKESQKQLASLVASAEAYWDAKQRAPEES